MAGNVTLTAALRSNLLSLQSTQKLLDTTQFRLATGLKVNSALDNASVFFTSQALSNNATDLGTLLDGMGQSIQVLKATDSGITAAVNLVNQMLSVAKQAKADTPGTSAATYTAQYDALGVQLTQLVGDVGYNGIKLLNSAASTSVVQFNVANTSSITLQGVDSTRAGLLLGAGANTFGAAALLVPATIDAEIAAINAALATLRSRANTFAQNLGVIQNRQDFSANLINILTEGSDRLVIADKNEEGAKLLSLQTTQQLGVQALSLASQANQSVLRLFQ